MKTLASLAAVFALNGLAFAQWSDDFNRADGPIGGNWTVVTGSWSVISNQGAHVSSSPNEICSHNLATGAYDSSPVFLDVFAPGSGSQFSGVLIGYGGTDAILVKIQDQVSTTPGFSNIGIYHQTSATGWGAWTGTGTGFANLTAPFLQGRMKVYFSDPDTIQVEIDENFDGTPEQFYSKTGVLSIAPNFGTSYGLVGWGTTALFDNWSVGAGGPPPIVTYCTAGTSTNGCVPTISGSAQPSVSQANACLLAVANVEGQKSGLLFYGVDNTGFTPLPWASGSSSFLCLKPPTQRMIFQSSGGTIGQCDGALSQDFNAFLSAFPAALGQPFAAGEKVYAQAWYRDPPAAKTTNLSDAIELTFAP